MQNTQTQLAEMNQKFKLAAQDLRKILEPLMKVSFFKTSSDYLTLQKTLMNYVSQINKVGSVEAVNNWEIHSMLKELSATATDVLKNSDQDLKLKEGILTYVSAVQVAMQPFLTKEYMQFDKDNLPEAKTPKMG